MEEVLRALNKLVEDKVVETYAIGGAIGASFYIAALPTEDVDAFVFMPESASGLVSLDAIYSALRSLGGVSDREFIRFGAWPLQVLPDTTPLVAEAIREAEVVFYGDVPTRVFSAKHLCAIALQTGRAKDILRVAMFLEQDAVDLEALRLVARGSNLEDKLAKVEADVHGGR